MKVNFIKQAGGILSPASEIEAYRLKRIKSGLVYEIDIKGGEKRNRGYHGKVFLFMNFCFEYWSGCNTHVDYQVEEAQFEYFRKQLAIKAGYFDYVVNLEGSTMIQARSLSYDAMSQEEFEQFGSAIINSAIATIFQGADEQTCNRLYSFF